MGIRSANGFSANFVSGTGNELILCLMNIQLEDSIVSSVTKTHN